MKKFLKNPALSMWEFFICEIGEKKGVKCEKRSGKNHSFTFLMMSSTIAFNCMLTSSFALISLSA